MEPSDRTPTFQWSVAKRICWRQYLAFLYTSHLAFFFPLHFVFIWCIHIGVWTLFKTWKKSRFILSDRSYFYMIDNLSTAFYSLARCILKSLSAEEMLQPRYVNWSINFRGRPLKFEMGPFYLKHMQYVLFAFRQMTMLPIAYFRLYRRDSDRVGVFVNSARSSASSAFVIVSAGYSLLLIFFKGKSLSFIRFIGVGCM